MQTNSPPDGWSRYTLRDVIERVVGGGTPSRTVQAYWNGDIRWASVKDFKDTRQILDDTEEHISVLGLVNSAANLIEPGAALVCTRMAVGRAASSIYPVAINQDIKALYPKEHLNVKYLLLLLAFIRPKLESLSIGSTVRGITLKDLLSLQVLIPPLPEQRRIADILDTVDAAIQQTEALIAKLKLMKAGLLHDLLTRGLDEQGHLRDPGAHPEQFKDSPLGRIPREWDAVPIDFIAAYVGSGITPFGGSKVYVQDGIPLIRSQNVTFDGLLLDDVAYIDARTYQSMRRSEIFPHDVLINITGASIGRCCPVPANLGEANVNQHVCAIRFHNPNREDAIFLSVVLASYIGQSQIKRLNAGSNREGINYQQLRATVVPWPAEGERKQIAILFSTHDARLRAEEAYRDKLKHLKQGLMRDLLTGRVRVQAEEEAL